MRRLLLRIIAWLLEPQRHAEDCPYRCPIHNRGWREWRDRKDRPGFRAWD